VLYKIVFSYKFDLFWTRTFVLYVILELGNIKSQMMFKIKHFSLLRYIIDCSCKKFYGTGPKKLTFKKVNELRGLENKPFGGLNSSWSQYFLKPFFSLSRMEKRNKLFQTSIMFVSEATCLPLLQDTPKC
jgi:hypothetical protein